MFKDDDSSGCGRWSDPDTLSHIPEPSRIYLLHPRVIFRVPSILRAIRQVIMVLRVCVDSAILTTSPDVNPSK